MRSAKRQTASYSWIAGCALLAACFSANKPLDSTQTGNPPVIDSDRVALKITNGEVHVIGEPGAVMPASATVEVTNLDSGAVERTKAASDGSFDVRVDGSPNAAFSVRVLAGGKASGAVYVVRGTAAVGDGRDGALSCDQRYSLAGDLLRQAAADADRSCESDADCRTVLPDASCHSQCQYAVVSLMGRTQIEEAQRDIGAGVCAAYATDECSHAMPICSSAPAAQCLMGQCLPSTGGTGQGPVSCNQLQLKAGQLYSEAVDAADKSCMADADCEIATSRVSCRDQCEFATPLARSARSTFDAALASIESEQCARFAADGCSAPLPLATMCPEIDRQDVACVQGACARKPASSSLPDCVTCLEQTLQWGYLGGFIPTVTGSRLEPCVHYIRTRTSLPDGSVLASCSSDLLACNAANSGGGVSTALAHADVQAALAQGEISYGFDSRGIDGQIFRITRGMQLIYVGDPCTAIHPDCKAIPPGVQALVDLLLQIDQFEAATPACAAFARP